jgi:hypothetical protein
MTTAMQQALLRRGCERLRQSLAECRDLPAGEAMLARLGMLAVLGLASRGPMLALPWREEPQPDRKMQAANDDTFKPH